MERSWKWIVASAASLLSLLAPIKALILCAVLFVAIDFVTGVWASFVTSRRHGENLAFESDRAWDTVTKMVFIMLGIVMAYLIDAYILDHLNLRLANLFTGFACGVEFFSYLENAAIISNHPIFKWLRKFMGKKVKDKTGVDIESEIEEEKGEA